MYKRHIFCDTTTAEALKFYESEVIVVKVPNDDLDSFLISGGSLVFSDPDIRDILLKALIKNWDAL